MKLGRLAAVGAAVLGLSSAACSSGRAVSMPYPTDPDPRSAYCLEWVPPTYRQVPTLVKVSDGAPECKMVWRKDVEFEEVCKPREWVEKCGPGSCHNYAVVQVEPPRTEWVKVPCCGKDQACCYRAVQVPGRQVVCEKTVTENGVRYCYDKPPEYDVVQHEVWSCAPSVESRPGEYKVCWQQELFQEGHWAWRETSGCGCPPNRCAPAAVVATGGCEGGCGVPVRGSRAAACPPGAGGRPDFSHAPAAD